MIINNKGIRAFWYMSNNFGDNLNYYLFEKISGLEPIYTDNRNEDHYIMCGSILSEANANTIVWGAGLGADYQRPNGAVREIHAVRGSLSADRVERRHTELKGLGDPALLMKRFYNPTIEKKHKYGLIPHWRDLEKVLQMELDPEVKIINPLQSVEKVIDDILSCNKILSTGLHGLILSDTYGVPNQWLELGTDVGGGSFKFRDYYSVTDCPNQTSVGRIDYKLCKVHNYIYSLEDFYNTCPFKQ